MAKFYTAFVKTARMILEDELQMETPPEVPETFEFPRKFPHELRDRINEAVEAYHGCRRECEADTRTGDNRDLFRDARLPVYRAHVMAALVGALAFGAKFTWFEKDNGETHDRPINLPA